MTNAQPPPSRLRGALLYVALPYLLLVALKLGLSSGLDVPLKPDELVYLGNARYLATGSGLVDPTGRQSYKVGYSLLLVPAFRLTDDPVAGFKATQLTNAFLLSLVYPLAFLLAGRLRRDLEARDRALLAGCLALYPAANLYATTAMSANAFLPAYFAYLLAAAAALTRPRWWSWAGFGVAAVYVYTVHERALGMVVVALGAAAWHLLRRPPRRASELALLVAVPVAHRLLALAEVPGAGWKTGSAGFKIVSQALSNPKLLVVTASGQLGYLGIATFGVLFTGLAGLWLYRRELAPGWRVPPRLFGLVLAASAGGVYAISVLFMSQRLGTRFTHWVYGRYNEGVLLPVLLVALLALRPAADGDRRRLGLAAGAAAALLAGLGLVLLAAWTPRIGPPYSFSAVSAPLFVRVHGWGFWVGGLAAGSVFLGLTALFARRWRLGVAALGALFALSTAVTYGDTWRQRYGERDDQRHLAELVGRIEPERRVIYRVRGGRLLRFPYFNLSYYLPDYRLAWLPRHSRGPLDGDLVVSAHLDLGRERPGTRLVGLENLQPRRDDHVQALWVLPGALQDRLDERGWLFPAGYPDEPLPPEVLRGEVELRSPPSERLRVGERWPLELALTHRGSAPWPHRGGVPRADQSIRLAAVFKPAAARRPAAVRWIDLPRVVYPGENLSLDARVPTRLRKESLPRGRYRVEIFLTQPREEEPGIVGGDTLELGLVVE